MMSSDDMLISIRLFRNPTLFVTPIQSHVVFLTFYNLDEELSHFPRAALL